MLPVGSLLQRKILWVFSPHFYATKKQIFKKVLKCLEHTGLMDRKTWRPSGSTFASCWYSLARSPSIDNHFRTPRSKVVKDNQH